MQEFGRFKKHSYLCCRKTKMVPWPSGEATVCKTVYSSSILLGTSDISGFDFEMKSKPDAFT